MLSYSRENQDLGLFICFEVSFIAVCIASWALDLWTWQTEKSQVPQGKQIWETVEINAIWTIPMNCVFRSYYWATLEILSPNNLTGQIVWPEFIKQNNGLWVKYVICQMMSPRSSRTESMPLPMTYLWGSGLCPLFPQTPPDCRTSGSLLLLPKSDPPMNMSDTVPWMGLRWDKGRRKEQANH